MVQQRDPTLSGPREVFKTYSPTFSSVSYTPWRITMRWGQEAREVVDFMYDYSTTRAEKRLKSYIIPGELERSKGSLRFGVAKEGHGYAKERGDFCLVGAFHKGKTLTMFYRSVELVAGIHFDYCIVDQIERVRGPINKVNIWACHAFVFGLKGNSGQKLHKSLKSFYR